jgi:hypothetical protein
VDLEQHGEEEEGGPVEGLDLAVEVLRAWGRGRCSPSDATLYILYRESLMKVTGRCQNDFNVRG